MDFFIRNKSTKERLLDTDYDTVEEAQRVIKNLGSISGLYEVGYRGDPQVGRILIEGLLKGDLDNILLPRVSIDEYTPKEDNDNLVVALFVQNVPVAVQPIKDYCYRCNGVVEVDATDSDTLVNTSIVYVEFKRKDASVSDVSSLIKEISDLANISISEMSLSFPHIDGLIPFDPDNLKEYFEGMKKK